MTLQARTKKTIAALSVAALVVAGGLAAVVTVLVKNAPETLPTVTAYAHYETVEAQAGVCDADLACAGLEVATLSVPEGQPLQLSLPKDVSGSDWRLNVQIGNPETGEVFSGFRDYTPGEASAVTVPSGENEQILGVIIQLPTNGGLAPVWAIQTY
ncbi:DUF2771 family protein [Rhodococcus kronopolitis]|uniref:DUF2771 family protein n=1 Tax=Rhodococcus kronopolitis TaxID=1460226 RepID=A0ABV9FR51_9NOCA